PRRRGISAALADPAVRHLFLLLRRTDAEAAPAGVRRPERSGPLLFGGRCPLPADRRGTGVGPRLSRHLQPGSTADARAPAAGAGAAPSAQALRGGGSAVSRRDRLAGQR